METHSHEGVYDTVFTAAAARGYLGMYLRAGLYITTEVMIKLAWMAFFGVRFCI